MAEADRVTVCALAGDLGFGFPLGSLERALRLKPDVIAIQGGSTDPGPFYLGDGKSFYPISGVRRDLEVLLPAAREARIPVVLSAGGAGASVHLEPVIEVLREVVAEKVRSLRTAVIYSDVPGDYLKRRIASGAVIERLRDWSELNERLRADDVDRSVRIVAQMGPEPIMRALQEGVDLVLAGRTVDASLFAALPLLRGYDPALAYHMAKTLECGAMAAVPGTAADGLIAMVYPDRFVVEPLALERRCTVRSIAGHTFYEREDPYVDRLPGGTLDLSEASYTQLDDRTVEVRGSRWTPTRPYTVKLEGAEAVGHRTVCVAGVRDSVMIEQIDHVLDGTREAMADRFGPVGKDYQLIIRVYGRDGVMGALEPERTTRGCHEICLVIDVVASTPELSSEICASCRSHLMHTEFPGCRTSAGNLAYPFSPSDLEVGRVYRFNIWHLLPLDDPCEIFPGELLAAGVNR